MTPPSEPTVPSPAGETSRARRERPPSARGEALSKVSSRRGGLALGTGEVSLALAALIAGFVVYLTITRCDLPVAAEAEAVPA
jgi:hypothetical protein